jgi:hypothetical protein
MSRAASPSGNPTFSRALRRNLVAGAIAGLCGAAVFALAHAILIVPIWNRSAVGLIWGVLAGTFAGWAYTELGFEHPYHARSLSAQLGSGMRFGALLWLAVAPVTLGDSLLRLLHVVPRYEPVAVAVALGLAMTGGAVLGWRRMHARRAVIAGASATLVLTLAMGGPVAVGRSLRALGIFLAVLPAAVVAGLLLAGLSRSLGRLRFFATRHRDGAITA